MKKHNKTTGFTLVELLVVISIIGLLATLAIVSLNAARTRSRDTKRASDLRTIQTALELYFDENDDYPASSLMILPSPWNGAANSLLFYLNPFVQGSSLPVDPLNNTTYNRYLYSATADGFFLSVRFEGSAGNEFLAGDIDGNILNSVGVPRIISDETRQGNPGILYNCNDPTYCIGYADLAP
ncbi:MAG: Type II secretory pathway pseudopilin PulG-like protein [uncultured bacterium]|nr:MAG: Type II secretory pathway pseudopilin PulG-like protein [uncultured bacterium]